MLNESKSRIAGKIAVAIEKPEKSSPISEIFGRSKFFLIHNTEDDSEEIISNPFANELGGVGIQSVRFLIEKNVDAVIVKKIGINPYRFFTSANIKVYHYKDGNAHKAIHLVKEEKIEQIDFINKKHFSGRNRERHGKRH
ncbi:MAG: NifB/NifX family molybdenum-iron cluster-binding protein [Melioribacteraceae bacterium]|nr:NifB/NifX family molybdenum-iron cluster-binding protein [Melioribacteraceae bacterium]